VSKSAAESEACSMMSERRKTVAVVDDDSSTLRATQTLLDAHGFSSIGFSSGEDFLRRDARVRVDCVLLDIDLGGESGIDVRRRLKAAGSPLPIIFMTALDSEALRQEAIATGCVAYLRKPFQGQQLVAALAKALPAPA
jgi:FixJ family two-component response regulator